MGEIKKELKFFSITKYVEEQEYLSSMHKKGWKFIKAVFPGIYMFEQCEPEDVTYQLDYLGKKVDSEYLQMFSDCGWEYICTFFGYSYFRKKASDMDNANEEIFCDGDSRLDMMRRIYTGRLLPMLVAFFLLILPQLAVNALTDDYSEAKRSVTSLLTVLFIAYMIIFFSFGKKYYKLEMATNKDSNKYKRKYIVLIITSIVITAAVYSLNCYSRHKDIPSDYIKTLLTDCYSVGAKYLDEKITHTLSINENQELVVNIVLTKGKMHVIIESDNGNIVLDNTFEDTIYVENLEIEETGNYTITLDGSKADGSYSFVVK